MPLVSCIIVLDDAAVHLAEAIDSVLQQTFEDWELLLVGRGASAGRDIALQYASQHANKMRCIDISDRNFSATLQRNLDQRSRYVAFLNPRDIWSPEKLAQQVSLLEAHQSAAMVYGSPLYWHSWSGKPHDIYRDYQCELGVQPETLVKPPGLVPLLVNNQYQTADLSDAMMRRTVWQKIEGAFDEGLWSCSVLTRLMLAHEAFASGSRWTKCRQGAVQDNVPRTRLLDRIEDCVHNTRVKDPAVWQALQQQRVNYAFDKVRAAISRHYPQFELEQIEFLGEGLNSRAYRINSSYIFRFPKHWRAVRGLQLEARLLKRLHAAVSLPIPYFEFVGNLAVSEPGRLQEWIFKIKRRCPYPGMERSPFVGYRELRGNLLYPDFLLGLSSEARNSLARQTGEFIRSLHAFPVALARKVGTKVRIFDRGYYEAAAAIARSQLLPRLDAASGQAIMDLLIAGQRDVERLDAGPVLLHGDLNWAHLIFDEHAIKIVGIIDFGDMFIGDPAHDFVQLWEKYGDEFLLSVLRYYGAGDPLQYLRRVATLHCCECLQRVRVHSGEPSEDELQSFRRLAMLVTERGWGKAKSEL